MVLVSVVGNLMMCDGWFFIGLMFVYNGVGVCTMKGWVLSVSYVGSARHILVTHISDRKDCNTMI